jgi:hypothetical protein
MYSTAIVCGDAERWPNQIRLILGNTIPKLVTEKKDAHVTLFYRNRGQRFTEEERARVQTTIESWMKGRSFSVTFTLSKWGARSDRIHGPLEDLYLHLQARCGLVPNNRPAHVELR